MKALTLKDTAVLKGLALLLLLIHHLFYINDGLYHDIVIGNRGIIEHIGKSSKLCVAIFVFLSGYGLMVSAAYKNELNVCKFYLTRFTKLMLNFWLIYVLFVSVNVLCFGNGFQEVYGGSLIAGIIDFCGLSFMFYGHHNTMNLTWWFYSLIIILYLLFPLIYRYGKTFRSNLIIGLFFLIFALLPISLGHLSGMKGYLPVFAFGTIMGWCASGSITWKHDWTNIPKAVLILLFISLFLSRPFWGKLWCVDDILQCALLVLMLGCLTLPKAISRSLEFLGKHSFNIFLFHTFIYYYWFESFIYSSRNPAIIFLLLFTLTLIVSIGIEWLKKGIGFYRLQDYILKTLKG